MSAALCWFAVGALTFEGVVAVAWYIHEPAWRRASTGWFLLFLLVRPLFIGFWIWEAIHGMTLFMTLHNCLYKGSKAAKRASRRKRP